MNDMQTSAMFKGDKQLPLHLKNDSLPSIRPSWLMSASFCFYEFKEVNKHSFKLIQRQVHSHIFHAPEKGGVLSQIESFILLFYESNESKLGVILV